MQMVNRVMGGLVLMLVLLHVISWRAHAVSFGSPKWTFDTGGGGFSSPAIGADGTIYVGSYDSNLYAVTSTGSLKWAFDTGEAVGSSPVIGPDETLYIASSANLYAINPTTQTPKWMYTAGAMFIPLRPSAWTALSMWAPMTATSMRSMIIPGDWQKRRGPCFTAI